MSNFFKKALQFIRRLDPRVDWDFWSRAYDFGANKKFYELGKFCRCKHRWYTHTKHKQFGSGYHLTDFDNGCQDCDCWDFYMMDPFQWVEYAREWINLIAQRSAYGYDYNRAVEKGNQIRP